MLHNIPAWHVSTPGAMGSFFLVSLSRFLKDRESDWLHSLFSIRHMSSTPFGCLSVKCPPYTSQRQFLSHSKLRSTGGAIS